MASARREARSTQRPTRTHVPVQRISLIRDLEGRTALAVLLPIRNTITSRGDIHPPRTQGILPDPIRRHAPVRIRTATREVHGATVPTARTVRTTRVALRRLPLETAAAVLVQARHHRLVVATAELAAAGNYHSLQKTIYEIEGNFSPQRYRFVPC